MEQVRTKFTFQKERNIFLCRLEKELPFYSILGKVDQESLRGFLKELSSEPHIAAGRRDK